MIQIPINRDTRMSLINMEEQKNKKDEDKKIKLSTLIYAVLVMFVVVIGVGSILAYGTETALGKKIAATVSKIVPFPAAIVSGTNFVYWEDIEKNLSSIEKFYQSQDLSEEGLRVDFSTPDGKKRFEIKKREILDKLVEDKIIEVLAKKRGISITKADIDKVVNKKLIEYGTSEDIKNDLLDSYGWSLDDFKQRVVLPGAYKDALSTLVSQENFDNSFSRKKIEQAKKDIENGKDFAEVAKEYSNGSSKDNGGELGWVKKDQIITELQESLFGKNPLEKNSIIESSIGFHIVEIEDRKKENGEDVLQLRQIFVAKDIFIDWLEEQKRDISVIVPLAGFTWDSALGMIDFRDEKMKTFEKEERAKVKGDASLMF